jgi:ribonucleoside-diphosphate reductase alpha chain
VNLPADATPDDIMSAYVEGWKLGLKALAIYRDGSKRTQPLNAGREEQSNVISLDERRPVRHKLADERSSVTHKFSIAGHKGYLTVGLYDDGNPGEIFLRMSKEGSTVSGLMDTIAKMTSIALQYGVPLTKLVDEFSHTRFEPSGFTNNPEIPMAKSLTDYIFRYLGSRFLRSVDDDEAGELESEALAVAAPAAAPRVAIAGGSGARPGGRSAQAFVNHADAPSCVECGTITVRNGACYKCPNCGLAGGCG